MYLNDFDLRQLEARNLAKLPVAERNRLLDKLLKDLLEARERLKANSSNRSRPPSSDPPWSGPCSERGAEEGVTAEFGKNSTLRECVHLSRAEAGTQR